jgi:hypothetical protein
LIELSSIFHNLNLIQKNHVADNIAPDMRYVFLIIIFAHAFSFSTQGQEAIERVFVEKFYCATASDLGALKFSGPINEGACTYRIYLDLKPGYRFQAAYGTQQHPLSISSSQMFFNHADIGNAQPNLIPARTLSRNITLLDSWLSAGAAGESFNGVPRSLDTIAEVKFEKGYLTSTTEETELSFSNSDGMVYVAKPWVPTFYNMDDALKGLTSVSRTNTIEVANGAWACMGKGAVGLDSLGTNMVLIGQLTTSGELNYALNIMVGTPEGKSIKYVYANPQDGELELSILKGSASPFKSRKVKKSKKKKVKSRK